MSLRDQLATDAAVVLQDFGEELLYHYADGASETIVAIVSRRTPASLQNAAGIHTPAIQLTLARPTGKAITPGVDTVEVAVNAGGAAIPQVVTSIESQDDAMLCLNLSH